VPDDNTRINDDDAFSIYIYIYSILAAEILSRGRGEFDLHHFEKLPTRIYRSPAGEQSEFEIKNHKKKNDDPE